jgi:DNA polymerase-3 subunit gamma/tau
MAYEVIARKYRPQTFEDVVGQDHVIQTLRNAIESERIAHAYLFVGPRGTGKTTTARIFAKALNCETGPTATPDNTCSICQEVSEGRSLDVREIDGASNNGVEQVRELRENARVMPINARYKIYIIDEVHMLSNAAFNALLKTLEEPPPHVKFVFATTEAHKVPATILSRCQRFDLRRISIRQITERLAYICEQEKIKADEKALLAIARGADGGMRDAQSALDQLIAFQGEHLTEEDVLSVFGLVAMDMVADLAGAVLDGNIPHLMDLVDTFDRDGKDLQRVLYELLEHLRNVLIYSYTQEEKQMIDLADSQKAAVKRQAEGSHAGRIAEIVDILIQSESQLRFALSGRTIFEMALIRSARTAVHVSIDEVMDELKQLRGQAGHTVQKKN